MRTKPESVEPQLSLVLSSYHAAIYLQHLVLEVGVALFLH